MKTVFLLFIVVIQSVACAQKSDSLKTFKEAERILRVLASDSMQGRKAETEGGEKAPLPGVGRKAVTERKNKK